MDAHMLTGQLVPAQIQREFSIRCRKLSATAVLPTYAKPGDAGMDLVADNDEPMTLFAGQRCLIPTNIAIELPPFLVADVRPRSGLAYKHGITVLNAPGTIDSGYRDGIGVVLVKHGRTPFEVVRGMRIAQLVFLPVVTAALVEADTLSDSERGLGGFGSTGTGVSAAKIDIIGNATLSDWKFGGENTRINGGSIPERRTVNFEVGDVVPEDVLILSGTFDPRTRTARTRCSGVEASR